MADKFNLKAIISCVDKLSPALRSQVKTLNTWKRQFASAGKGAMPMAAGLGAAMLIPAKAFVEAENAATQLQNTLMNKSGVSGGFKEISKIAVDLGNQLPGTTADFMSMASQLNALGVSADTIAGGALKATAYLAVIGKPLGVTYESAAEAVGKLGKSFGIAANDLVPFADTLQRALHMGTDLTEMQYAMAKVAPRLKGLGVQGLGVANDLVPLVAMLTSMGMTGETAGTGLEKVIAGAVKVGKFKDIPNLVKDLEKMNKLGPSEKLLKFQKLFGEEGARVAMVVAAGGYTEMLGKMEKQASLQQRINNSLGTLGNLWEAATGTFTNAMVAFATAYAPELKKLSENINTVSEDLLKWSDENPGVIKTALEMAGSFVGLKLACAGVAFGIGLITTAMKANPIMLLASAVALAAPLIIDNWGLITETLTAKWKGFIDFIQPGIDVIKSMLQWVNNNGLFKAVGGAVMSAGKAVGGSLPDLSNSDEAGAHGMRPPGAVSPVKMPNVPDVRNVGNMFGLGAAVNDAAPQGKSSAGPRSNSSSPLVRQNIVQASAPAQQVKGAIDINFNNAPQGMRVEPAKTSGPLTVRPSVGYRSFATGAQ